LRQKNEANIALAVPSVCMPGFHKQVTFSEKYFSAQVAQTWNNHDEKSKTILYRCFEWHIQIFRWSCWL